MKAKNYINYVISALIFVTFLVSNLVVVKFARQDFLDILLNSGLMFICWLILRNAMANQGVINGNRENDVRATKKDHIETSNEISAYKADFNIWCDQKNAERLKQKRLDILSRSTLLYEDYFDKFGNFLNKEVPLPEKTDNKKLNRINQKKYRRDCRCLNKARFAFVAPYLAEEICAREKIGNDKTAFNMSVKKWKATKIAGSVIFSLVLSLVFSFIEAGNKTMTFNAAMIMVFQIALMLASAFVFYASGKNFICGEWREGLIQKIRIMEEFYRSVVGSINYENDIKREDGSVIVGKKLFVKKADYEPLKPLKASKDEREDKEAIQTKNERALAVVKEESFKQTNDSLDNSRGSNLLESCDNLQHLSPDSESVVLDSNECDNALLGGTIYASSTTTDRASTGAESNIREDKKEEGEER